MELTLARSEVCHHVPGKRRALNMINHVMQDSDVAKTQITAGSATAADNKHSGSPKAEDLAVKKGLSLDHDMAKGEHAQPVEFSCNENERGVREYGGKGAGESAANQKADEDKEERAYMQGQLGLEPLVGVAKLVEYSNSDEDEGGRAEVVLLKAREVQSVPEEREEVRWIYATA
jgi:hypothetical protein